MQYVCFLDCAACSVVLRFSDFVLVLCKRFVLRDKNSVALFRNDSGHGVYMQNTNISIVC